MTSPSTYLSKHPYCTIWAVIFLFLILWETASRTALIDSREWTAPSEVARSLVKDSFFVTRSQGDHHRSKSLLTHAAFTVFRWLQGFGVAACIGVTFGYILGRSDACSAIGYPLVNVLRSLPSAAFWPVLGLLIGYNSRSQTVVVAFGATWPILINTMNAIRHLPQEARDSMRFISIEWWRRSFAISQWALPGIYTGLEIGCAIAFLLTVTVELLWPASGGLGWYLTSHQEYHEQDRVFAGLIVTAALAPNQAYLL